MPYYGGNWYSMDDMAMMFPQAYYGFAASGGLYDDPRNSNAGNFFPAEDDVYVGGGGGGGSYDDYWGPNMEAPADFSIDHTEYGPQYPDQWTGSWDWSTGQQDPAWNTDYGGNGGGLQQPDYGGGGGGGGDPYENIDLPDIPWEGPPADIIQPSSEPNFPPPPSGLDFEQPPEHVELQPPGPGEQPEHPEEPVRRPWWDKGPEDTGVDQAPTSGPIRSRFPPTSEGNGGPSLPVIIPIPPIGGGNETTAPAPPATTPPATTTDPHGEDGTGPPVTTTPPATTGTGGDKKKMNWKDILTTIFGGVRVNTGTGGTPPFNPEAAKASAAQSAASDAAQMERLKAILAVLGPIAGSLANTEAARTGKSSSTTKNTNTISNKRDLTPQQQQAMDQLSTLSSEYMTNPMKAVEPLRAPGMAQINANYKGMPQSIANKTLAFGGNSGKFGKAVQAAEMGRTNDFSTFEGGLARLGYEGQMKGADIGSSLLSQDLGRTTTTTSQQDFEGTNVNPGSAVAGGFAGGVDAITSILLLDQLNKSRAA